jgi:hypothetical protein
MAQQQTTLAPFVNVQGPEKQLLDFVASYARQACQAVFDRTGVIAGQATYHASEAKLFVRIPLLIAGRMHREGRELQLVFAAAINASGRSPLPAQTYQVWGPRVELLRNGNFADVYNLGSGRSCWLVDKQLDPEVFEEHYRAMSRANFWDFVLNAGRTFFESGRIACGAQPDLVMARQDEHLQRFLTQVKRYDLTSTGIKQFPLWLQQLSRPRCQRLLALIRKVSASGVSSFIQTIVRWELVTNFESAHAAASQLYLLEAEVNQYLAPSGCHPMNAALGANLKPGSIANPAYEVALSTLEVIWRTKLFVHADPEDVFSSSAGLSRALQERAEVRKWIGYGVSAGLFRTVEDALNALHSGKHESAAAAAASAGTHTMRGQLELLHTFTSDTRQ